VKKRIVFYLTVFFATTCFAQNYTEVISNDALDSLVKRNQFTNQMHNSLNGFRVQIFFGSERKAANDVRTKFLQMYPNENAYLIYQQPNFKVRVGDYRNQLEAQVIYRDLLTHFEKVFIVPDKINLPKL